MLLLAVSSLLINQKHIKYDVFRQKQEASLRIDRLMKML